MDISFSSLVNKKNRKRTWKITELEKLNKIIVSANFDQNNKIINDYTDLIKNLHHLVKESGYRLDAIKKESGLGHNQWHSRSKNYLLWEVDEVIKILNLLHFWQLGLNTFQARYSQQ